MRANLRRCHFMKVFEENRHVYMLNEKKQRQEQYFRELGRPLDMDLESDEDNQEIWGDI